MVRGGFSLKSQGFASALTVPDQPCMGLPTNPAQMTTAARFGGLVAAYQQPAARRTIQQRARIALTEERQHPRTDANPRTSKICQLDK